MLESIGQAVVLFCFNVLVTNALVFATKGTLLRSARAHLVLLAIATGAIIAPWIASYGSSDSIASLPAVPRALATVLATILSQAGLWAEAYLVTGLVLDAISRKAPSQASVVSHQFQGVKKGIVFSGTFMGLLYTLGLLWQTPGLREMAADYPLAAAALAGTLVFPLVKTIVESFDGSTGFFRRIAKSYSNPVLYLRGAIVGLGLGYAVVLSLSESELSTRVWFGFGVGVLAYAGVDLVRDLVYGMKERGGPQPARVYLVHGLLGGFIGAAIGFYLDAAQVAVVVAKFHRYLAAGVPPEPFDVYPLLSKWGFINLGDGHRRREPAVRRGPGGRHQLVDPGLALRDQPDVHGGLLPEGRRRRSGARSPAKGLSQLAREHDRGPPLGPVDVADHQLVPPADGRADLVQPGRRDPDGPGDRPGRRR